MASPSSFIKELFSSPTAAHSNFLHTVLPAVPYSTRRQRELAAGRPLGSGVDMAREMKYGGKGEEKRKGRAKADWDKASLQARYSTGTLQYLGYIRAVSIYA